MKGPFGMDWLPDLPGNSIGWELQKGDDSAGDTSEDKTIDGMRFLMEPKHENISMDGFSGFGREKNNGSGFNKMEEVCLGFDLGIWPNHGGADSYCALEEEAGLKLDIFDGFLDEVDEVEHIYASQDPFPIDTEGAVKVSESDNDLNGARNSSSPGISGSVGLSNSLKEAAQQPESRNVSRDEVVWEVYESEDDKKPLASFIASRSKHGGDQKKPKPPCSDYMTNGSDSLGGAVSPRSYDFRPRRGSLKKCHLKPDRRSDNEVTSSESEEEDEFSVSEASRRRSGCDRRKHQRMWTLAEVVRLVDGISQFGVGRWTNIKNLFFHSASHRTPIDLRDKWRNLLRASYYASRRNDGEVEEGGSKNHARPVPKHVLNRILELATLYPYPCSKSSPFVSDASRAQSSVSARTVSEPRKKKKKKKKRC